MARGTTTNWAEKSREELEAVYWTEITPQRREDGFDPEVDVPTHAWLRDHGYRGLISTLRRHHDLTVGEFFEAMDVAGDDEEYWAFVDHEPTRALLTEWIDGEFRRRKDRPESSIRSVRSRLKRYVTTYEESHGSTALLDGLRDRDRKPDEIDRVLQAFEALDEAVATDRAKFQYLSDVRQWYDFAVETGRADYNPAATIPRRFDWSRETTDGPALSAAQVRMLYDTAENIEERLVVVAICGWGLRTSEVAALHHEQFVLDDGDGYPHLEFDDDRKNGPGTVTILNGTEVLETRLAQLVEDPDWTGYLFPSESAESGHRSANTIRRRFNDVANRADVTIDERSPVPKWGRRFWYRTYSDAIEAVAGQLRDIADEQGSSDPQVVVDNYLSSAEKRRQRRTYMADRLSEVFE